MEIKKNLTEVNYTKGNGRKIEYIVIHYTANDGDTAQSNTKYFKDVNRNASAHYFVDENEIWQCVEDEDIAWHCGSENGKYYSKCRNSTSIGIELCSRKDSDGNYYFLDKTLNNALELTRYIMNKYNIVIGNIIRHFDVTHKICPAPFVNDVSKWDNFKKKLEVKKVEIKTVEEAIKVLNEKKIITDMDYWINSVKYYKNVDSLLIKVANYIENAIK